MSYTVSRIASHVYSHVTDGLVKLQEFGHDIVNEFVLDVDTPSLKTILRRTNIHVHHHKNQQGMYNINALRPLILALGIWVPASEWDAFLVEIMPVPVITIDDDVVDQPRALVLRPEEHREHDNAIVHGADQFGSGSGPRLPHRIQSALEKLSVGQYQIAEYVHQTETRLMQLEADDMKLRQKIEIEKKKYKRINESKNYWQTEALTLREKMKKTEKAIALGPKRGAGRYFSMEGGFFTAVQKNGASGAGAQAVADILNLEASRKTIVWWENKAGTALIAATRSFHQSCIETCRDALSAGLWTFFTLAFSGDATNSDIFQNSKVQSMFLAATYFAADLGLGVEDLSTRFLRHNERWLDVQICKGHDTDHNYHLMLKQLIIAGAPHWLVNMGAMLHAVCVLGDNGPDQKGTRKKIKHQVAQLPRGLCFDGCCLKHQVGLLSKTSYVASDDIAKELGIQYKYFSTMAKAMNFWREPGHSKDIFARWKDCRGNMIYYATVPGVPNIWPDPDMFPKASNPSKSSEWAGNGVGGQVR